MKHTPGPWAVGLETSENDGHGQVISKKGEHIASVSMYPIVANTNLISASTELFDCVAAFVRRFGIAVECDEEINGGDAVEWISRNMGDFKAAFKKAKGRKP